MKRLAVLVLGSVLSLSGCASVFGTACDPVPYAGLQVASQIAGSDPLVLIDMPASFALDTLLLPITVPYAAAEGRSEWRFRSSGF